MGFLGVGDYKYTLEMACMQWYVAVGILYTGELEIRDARLSVSGGGD